MKTETFHLGCTEGYMLKPCPYCKQGYSANIEYAGTSQSWGVETCQVVCLHCGTRGPHDKSAKDAASAWNRMTRI